MALPRQRSVEQSWIDMTNKRIRRLYDWIPSEDNKYAAAWERALKSAKIDYTLKTKNGQEVPVIANTAANRDKVDELRRQIEKKNARSLSDLREQAKKELKEAGEKRTKKNVEEKLRDYKAYATLQSNVDFVYERERQGDYSLTEYTDRLRGRHSGTKAYTKNVRLLSAEVAKLRETEREAALQSIVRPKRKVDEDSPY